MKLKDMFGDKTPSDLDLARGHHLVTVTLDSCQQITGIGDVPIILACMYVARTKLRDVIPDEKVCERIERALIDAPLPPPEDGSEGETLQ